MGTDFSGNIGDKVNSIIDELKNGQNYKGAAYQLGLNMLASKFNADPASAIAMGQGKTYNPNAEMIYKQPYHRKFTFSFDFTPKNREEASTIDQIITEFKTWSAPEYADQGFMHIPHLWRITYHEAGGKVYRRMNLFKPSMMTSCVVQDNVTSDFHMTIRDIENGHTPVVTSMNLMFEETMPPTREDHTKAVGEGYVRGY